MTAFGFDIAHDLFLCLPRPETKKVAQEEQGRPLLRTTRGLTTQGLYNYCGSFTGRELLEALPYTVEDVQARITRAGARVAFGSPAFYTWKIRLAVEEGLLAPAQVDTLAASETLNGATKAVWRGFVFLLACKWLYRPGEPTVYSRAFAAPWSGVTEQQAKDAITTLKRAGYMVDTGKRHRRATIWLPRRPD